MEQRLATVNLADPDPPRWEYLLFASHPSTVERMAAARAYASGRAVMGRTLLVTNDFPPRAGGIQQFVHNLAVRQPPDSLVVYASRAPGWEEFDAEQPFEVIREDTAMLLPTPAVARRVVAAGPRVRLRPGLVRRSRPARAARRRAAGEGRRHPGGRR